MAIKNYGHFLQILCNVLYKKTYLVSSRKTTTFPLYFQLINLYFPRCFQIYLFLTVEETSDDAKIEWWFEKENGIPFKILKYLRIKLIFGLLFFNFHLPRISSPLSDNPLPHTCFYCLCRTSTKDTEKKNKKTTGLDNLPLRLLKDSASVFSKPIAYIINRWVETATVPALWKVQKFQNRTGVTGN